ncbi:MAG: hypothetical protein KIA10_07885 [Enterococcus faecium]|uniref:hypothetical protein n=1 Tax=Enterococcus faecium TaxID=1352 RepID=UPI000CF0ECA2|nr:hypothetical protein [Enterococcus faecium]EGP5399207.1 hypothetical protein [Enterococcus faecium]EGP5631444.1 hypothetical protein [Enterococcus faecium]MBS6011592.1 hypothetical protein [Enterococcus faecium]PQC81073.1 hypothetical protein CUM69_04920 [Enterococcus faecium]
MLSIESKKSKRVSVVLLVFCMILLSSHLYIRHEVIGFLIIQYSCWILSGISLAFTRRMDSIKVKWLVITLHFLLICGLGMFYIIGWLSLSRLDLLLVCVLYIGLVEILEYKQKEKAFFLFGLGLPMLISISLLIWIHYLLAFYLNTDRMWAIIALLLFMMISGLMGLYFSTKLEDNRIKWLLLGMNYLFATYYNVVLLFFL